MKSRPDNGKARDVNSVFRKPVTLGGQHRSDGRARQVFGDGMHGRLRDVNQGDLLRTRREFAARSQGTKSPLSRSQSGRSSEEAG